MNWETLLSFGDSITFGARSYLGYPEICGDHLMRHLHKSWHVVNHSTNGFTTMDLQRSINPLMQNFKSLHPGIITVMIGTNDIKQKVSLADFEIAYRQLIVKLRLLSVSNNVLLLHIPRFTKKVVYPYNYSMNEKVEEFNAVIERLAREHDLRSLAMSFHDMDFFDGVHFNQQGCENAARQLTDYLLKDKGLEELRDRSEHLTVAR